MEIGMIGLGRMGGNMADRLARGGHRPVVYDRDPRAVRVAESHGATAAGSTEDLVKRLNPPRAIWVMVPSGDPTEETILDLIDRLSAGDIVIDGGNSNYRDSKRRGSLLKKNFNSLTGTLHRRELWFHPVPLRRPLLPHWLRLWRRRRSSPRHRSPPYPRS